MCQLAVLDHNAHAGREVTNNKKEEQIYHCKYREQAKNGISPSQSRLRNIHTLLN